VLLNSVKRVIQELTLTNIDCPLQQIKVAIDKRNVQQGLQFMGDHNFITHHNIVNIIVDDTRPDLLIWYTRSTLA